MNILFTGNRGNLGREMIPLLEKDHTVQYANVDYSDPDDKLSNMYSAYQLSTEWGVIKNKLWPSLKAGRGRDLLTHSLKLYPNEYTKKLNQHLFGRKPKDKKKKTSTNYDRALKVLEAMSK